MAEIAPAGQSVMLGGGFYSHNSRPQRAAATAADVHLAAGPMPHQLAAAAYAARRLSGR